MPHAPLARNRPLRLLALAGCAGVCGCFSEYHPEYHPETSYSVVQRVEYATTVVTPAGSASSPSPAAPVDPVEPSAPPPRPQPPSASLPGPRRGTASLAGDWLEHVPGTTCDREVSIEEIDGVPYAKLHGCHGGNVEDALRTLDAKDGGLRVRRQDPHDSETLDYRLARAGPDELRGTVVRHDRSSSAKPTKYPVVWRRGGPDTTAATGPYASLAGLWSESLDELDKEGQARGEWGRYCDDEIAVEADAQAVRAYDHFCFSGHFENSVLTLIGDQEGTLRFRLEGSARYGTVDYLLRRVGGRLQGFVVYNPSPTQKGMKPSHRGVTWSRR
jgi:hypothetical protein